MRRACLGLIVVWLAGGSTPALAADLTKIERTIAKQPAYQSKPKYCLLVFGIEAKARFWLVLDGETLHVDRNANGDLTEAGESTAAASRDQGAISFKVADLIEPDGKTKHTCLYLLQREKGSVYLHVRVEDGRIWWAGFDDYERLEFSDRPADAPIIHFNGPRTFGLLRPRTFDRVPQGEAADYRLRLSIGTRGLGPGTFAALDANQIPSPRRLSADIEFPSADGGEPIKVREEFALNT
jgi:hypothetical protein